MKSNSIAKLTEALVKAQLEMKAPVFDSVNPHFKNKFASLGAVRDAVLPVLNKHGLSLSQWPSSAEGMCGCTNLLSHVSGEWIEETILLPLDKNNAQGAGSAITYARRYSLQAIAGVVADEDDDANAASTPARKKASENGPAKPTSGARERLDEATLRKVEGIVEAVKAELGMGNSLGADELIEMAKFDADEEVAFWTYFDSTERGMMKQAGGMVDEDMEIADKLAKAGNLKELVEVMNKLTAGQQVKHRPYFNKRKAEFNERQ